MVITDPTGSIEYVNPKFTEITGYSLAEALGKSPCILKSGHTPPEVHERLWQAITAGKEWRGEILNRKKNGELFWGRASISPIVDEAGRVTHFLAVNEDITERRRADKALRLLNEELMRSNNELEQFAYVASHDLQEPLRMVASYTDLLAERYAGKLDEKADKFIRYAVEGARRMQELINDLLALSRVNSRGEPFEIVACADVVAKVRQDLAKAIEESGAEICVGGLPVVLAARTQLAQLFQNLIGNAIKFRGDASPRVEISAAQDGSNWVFTVKDNGIGIAREFHERVFVIFQRLHERQKYSGSGIGPAIAKKIVERHKGRIWVESEVGAGTHFFFSIPCSTNERKVIDEQENRDSDGGGQSGGYGSGAGKTYGQQVPA